MCKTFVNYHKIFTQLKFKFSNEFILYSVLQNKWTSCVKITNVKLLLWASTSHWCVNCWKMFRICLRNISAINKNGSLKKKKTNSMQTRHTSHKTLITKKNHIADFDNVRVLNKYNNNNRLLTIESLYIQRKLSTTMNTKEYKDEANWHYQLPLKI